MSSTDDEKYGLHLLQNSQLALLRDLIQEKTGIYYPPRKDYLLQARIQSLAFKTKLASPAAVLHALLNKDEKVWELFIRSFTTNHTFFFREPEHFNYMVHWLSEKHCHNPKIWDAATSTGEEVYSIAISLEEAGFFNYMIMASDINRYNLVHMREGQYHESRVHQVSPKLLQHYFSPSQLENNERIYTIRQNLKRNILARTLNLTEQLHFEDHFDIIFCRNVLMYFTPQTQISVISMLSDNLASGGLLFLGQSENPINTTIPHELKSIGISIYQKE